MKGAGGTMKGAGGTMKGAKSHFSSSAFTIVY